MRRNFVPYTLVVVFASGVSAAQYQPASPERQPTTKTQPQTSTAPDESLATLEGCLVREADVPGREPNLAEKAGAMEDYILTHARVIKGSAPPAAAAPMRPGEATGTSGTMLEPMYDVKGIEDMRLKMYVGKRVQIDGAFDDVEKSPSAKPTEDLVDIRGTTIRSVAGECK